MNEEIKNKLIEHVPTIIIIVMLVVLGMVWSWYQTAKSENTTLRSQININETIHETQKRLEEIQKREAQYKELEQKRDSLQKSIDSLEQKRKELEKRKKEKILNELQKLNETDIINTFGSIGISGTIVE